jgi:hypothetical protein
MSSIIFGKAAWLQRATLVLVAASLSGCFDDGSSGNNGIAAPITEQPSPQVPVPTPPGSEQPPPSSEPPPPSSEQPPPIDNEPPEVSGTPAATVVIGQTYSFQPVASDADEDFLEYTITNKPNWATFNDETGLLTGVPTDAYVGESEDITITVTDGKDTRSIGPFKIRVNRTPPPPNTVPTITGTPQTSVVVGDLYQFQPQALDADGDTLRFSISNRPSWATFSSTTGLLRGTPTTGNVATYSNIIISVNDGRATTLLPAFSIQVRGPDNNAPTISGTPGASVQAGQTYTFVPSATDPDGDTLVYSILNQPRWANFSTASGRLSGTPASTDVGTYSNVTIRVSDGRVQTSLPAFTINVTAAANRAPTITGSPATSGTVGTAYSFTPSATDPDGGTLGFTIQNRPTWAAFDTATGRLSGTPTATGTFSNIIITVSDGRLTASLPAFAITVNQPSNSAPTISGSPATTASAGAAYNFQPTANDPNGDTLTFSIQNAPSWAQFSASTGRLSGTPTSANAGTYSNIIISVSDGTNRVSLPAFAITVAQATNGSATLSWTPPTQNTDGSTLTNLTGYRVVYGRSSTSLDQIVQIANAGASAYTVTGLSSGTWYFAVKAYNSAGAESNVSNVGTKAIP